ncbi:TOM1-like protein 2 [Tripterygium wilfordii]|uniref:TOM1-like protein 2 n=1 Tax=Tripterygium wilfordii TaxID=458696 RepID=A0A7J7DLG4_TRIWF|nr:TOM1-like protein 1 [Tripterygium wilfordii]KAF5747205.1 TOM1-like protein 2 [Tripterygium wilfordii]
MSDNLMEKVTALGERLKIGGTEVGRKMSAGMSSISFKMKEIFQGPNQADKLVEEATSEALEEPDWAMNLEICDMMNHEKISSIELIRGIKKQIMMKNPRVQYLALVLLETCAKNCEKAFSEIAAERVLDEMVKLIDDPQTVINNRNKALLMIEAWGESTNELRYLPAYEETYKSLKSRGIRFPGRDNESLAPIFTPPRSVSAPEVDAVLAQQIERGIPVQSFTAEQTKEAFDVARNSIELLTTVLSSSPQQDALEDDLTVTLVQQCRQSQTTVQRIVETAGDNEALLFEALNVNDEIQKALSKYEDMKKPSVAHHEPEPAMIPVSVEPDESPRHAKEDALIRKHAGSRGGTPGASNDDMMDDLDEMIFGRKSGGTSDGSHDGKKQQSPKDDLISF